MCREKQTKFKSGTLLSSLSCSERITPNRYLTLSSARKTTVARLSGTNQRVCCSSKKMADWDSALISRCCLHSGRTWCQRSSQGHKETSVRLSVISFRCKLNGALRAQLMSFVHITRKTYCISTLKTRQSCSTSCRQCKVCWRSWTYCRRTALKPHLKASDNSCWGTAQLCRSSACWSARWSRWLMH